MWRAPLQAGEVFSSGEERRPLPLGRERKQGGKEGAGCDAGELCLGAAGTSDTSAWCSAPPVEGGRVEMQSPRRGVVLAALGQQLPSSSPRLNIPACILGVDINASAWPLGRCWDQETGGVNTAPRYRGAGRGDAHSTGCSPRGCPGSPAHCPRPSNAGGEKSSCLMARPKNTG